MEQTFIEWLVGQAGLAGIAGLALWMLNAVWKQRLAEMQVHIERERSDKLRLADVLAKNTDAIATMTETMRQVCERLPIKTARKGAGGVT